MANQHNHHDDDDYIDEEAMMNFVSGVIVDPYERSHVEEEGRPQDPAAATTHPVLPPVADVPPDVLLAELSDHVLQNAHGHHHQRPGKALAYEFQGQMEAGGQSSSSAAAYSFDDHVQLQQQVQAATTTTMPISIEDYLQQVPGESPSAFLDQVYGGEFQDVLQEIQGGQQGAPSYDHVQGLAAAAAEEESCAYDSTDYDRMLHECWMACGGNPEETPALPGSGEDDEEQFFSSPSTDVDSPPFLDSFLLSGLSDVADALMRNEVNNAIGGDNCNNPQQAAAGFADDQFNFVPFVPGEVNCGNCHLVREIDHRSDSRVLRLLLHSAAPGTFEHAIIDRKHGGDDEKPPMSELLYINLRGRTQEWVLGFMANLVEKLGNDTSGTLEDNSFDPFHAAAASSSANPKPKTPKPKPKTPIPNPLHAQQLENGMLNMMLYPSDIHGAQPPAMGDDDAANTIDDTPFYVTILESSLPLQPQAEQSGQNAAVHPSHAPIMGSSHAPQEEQYGQQVIITERLTMEEMKQYIKDQMEKAREELKVPSAVIRKFCRENASYTWIRIRIRKLNKKISKLAMSSQDCVKRSVIEEARKTINGYAVEKAHLKADIMRGMKKERGDNGCTSSRPVDNNNNEAGPSGT